MGTKQGSVRSLFVTSTFRDMHAERDWLRNHVFPVLEERLRERGLRLEPVDLRWGVQTVDECAEESKEQLVLKVCLGEIERSRPFLIALIGDRYGWVPPEARAKAAVREAGLKGEWQRKSITALELEHGALSVPERRRRCFVYLREPLPYEQMPAGLAAEYSDAHGADRSAGQLASQRLAKLKGRLKAQLGSRRVRSYAAQWDASAGRVTGLEGFGEMVLQDLWGELEKELAAYRPPTTEEEAEALEIERFATEQAEGFIGRRALLADLTAFAQGNWKTGERCLCLAGEAGTGKSALLARLYRELIEKRGTGKTPLVIYHPAGLSPRTGRLDWTLRRWIGQLSAAAGIEVRIPKKADLEKLGGIFQDALATTAGRRRVILLVDALNQFERNTVAEYVQWLPDRLPEQARVICTAIPGKETRALAEREGCRLHELPAYSAEDAEELIRDICARHRRQVHPDVVKALLSRKAEKGKGRACGNLLWLKTAVEELNLLDEDDFRRARKAYRGSEDQRLHKLVLATAKTMNGTADGLYRAVLARLEDAYGERLVRSLMEWIAVSRTGWRESDLEVLWKEVSKSPWDPLRFAAIRRGLRGHLVQRGTRGQWDFAHPQLRQAVLGGRKKAALRRCHSQVAEMLENLPEGDALRIRERMFHLIGADDHLEAAYEYALAEGESLAESSRTLAGHALVDWTEPRHPGMDWVLGLLDPEWGDELLERSCNQFIFNLAEEMSRYPRLAPLENLLDQSRKALEGLRARHPRNRDVRRNLSVSYNKLAGVAEQRGDWPVAEKLHRHALVVREALAKASPENVDFQRDLSIGYNQMAGVVETRGDWPEAEKLYRKAMAITETLAKASPESIGFQRDLSISYERLASVAEQRGDWPEAEKLYRKAQTIWEALAKASPENVDFRRGLSVSHERLAGVAEQRGDWPEAEKLYRKALAISEALVKASPENVDYHRNLSVCYEKLAGVAEQRGDWPEAEKLYRKSLAIAEALAKASPENVGLQRDLSVSYERLAGVAEQRGDWPEAEKLYWKSLAIAEALAKASPENVDYQRGLSVSYERLAGVAKSRGDWPEAEKLHRQALVIREALAKATPESVDFQRDLSVSYYKLAEVAESRGDWPEAEKLYRKAHTLMEVLTKASPENVDFRRDLSVSYNKLAEVAEQRGKWVEAEKLYRKALVIREVLAKALTDNVDYQSDLSVSIENLARVAESRGEWEAAERLYWKSLAIAEALAKASPENVDYQRGLSVSYERLAGVAKSRGDWPEAEKLHRQALVIREALAKATPESVDFQRDLSVSYYKLAEVAESRGDWPEAERLYREALAIAAALTKASPENVEYQRNLSVSYERLGSSAELRGEWGEAEKLYRLALAISKSLAKASPENVECQRDLLVSYNQLAGVAEQRGAWGVTEKLSRKALAIAEALAKASPENVDFQRDLACSYGQLGLLLRSRKSEQSLQYVDSCLGLFCRLEKIQPGSKSARQDVADGLLDAAKVRVACGRMGEAKKHLAEAEGCMKSLDDPGLKVKKLLVVAEIGLVEGEDARKVVPGIRAALKLIKKHSLARLRKEAEKLLERCKPQEKLR